MAVWSLWHGPFLPDDVGFSALLVFSPCLVPKEQSSQHAALDTNHFQHTDIQRLLLSSQALGPEKVWTRVANSKLWRKQLSLEHLCQGYKGPRDSVFLAYHLSNLPIDPTLLGRANPSGGRGDSYDRLLSLSRLAPCYEIPGERRAYMLHWVERSFPSGVEAGRSQSHTVKPEAVHRGKGVIREK